MVGNLPYVQQNTTVPAFFLWFSCLLSEIPLSVKCWPWNIPLLLIHIILLHYYLIRIGRVLQRHTLLRDECGSVQSTFLLQHLHHLHNTLLMVGPPFFRLLWITTGAEQSQQFLLQFLKFLEIFALLEVSYRYFSCTRDEEKQTF